MPEVGRTAMLDLIWQGTTEIPGLEKILATLADMLTSGVLLRSVVASLFRVTAGFYLAVFLAVPLGLFLGRKMGVNRWANPIIQFLRPISPLAWIPFALLWFGIGDKPALFIIFIASFFPLLISTIEASASIHPMYFQVAANLQLSFVERIRYVILPASMPGVVLAMKVTLGVSWMVVVAAEMIAVKSGLGYLIIDGRNALRMDVVIAAMLTIGGIGFLMDHCTSRLEKMEALRWKLERK
jgi:NitT/TauT family transport system permease protein